MTKESPLTIFAKILAWFTWFLIGTGTVMFVFILPSEGSRFVGGTIGIVTVSAISLLALVALAVRLRWVRKIQNPLLRAALLIVGLVMVQQIVVVLGCFMLGPYSPISSTIGILLTLAYAPVALFETPEPVS